MKFGGSQPEPGAVLVLVPSEWSSLAGGIEPEQRELLSPPHVLRQRELEGPEDTAGDTQDTIGMKEQSVIIFRFNALST